MSEQLYQEFIDGLVAVSDSIQARRIEIGFQHPEPSTEEKAVEEFVSSLTAEQKQTLIMMLAREKRSGIHDVLVFFEGQEYAISDPEGRSLQGSPYAEMHYDYIARMSGDPWPM